VSSAHCVTHHPVDVAIGVAISCSWCRGYCSWPHVTGTPPDFLLEYTHPQHSMLHVCCITFVLRCSFHTPLWFDEQQLVELAGTTLAAATAARQASLARTWERLQPAVSSMLKQVRLVASRLKAVCWLVHVIVKDDRQEQKFHMRSGYVCCVGWLLSGCNLGLCSRWCF
jgi:hypothetical protein